MMKPPMRRAKIAGVQLTIAVLLCEVLLRIYHPLPFVLRGNDIVRPIGLQYRRHHPPDPRLDDITIHTRNSLGFRGPEPPADFRSRVTIVAVGGSTTADGQLTDGKTWPEVLGTLLARTRRDTWVNNAGFDGHTTAGHLVLLRSALIPLKPTIMLVLAGANDIGMPNSAIEDEFAQVGGHLPWNRLSKYSELVNSAVNLMRAWRASRMVFAGVQPLDFRALPQRDMTEAELAAGIAPFTTQLGDYDGRLTRLGDEARRAGITPIFLTQPALVGDAIDPATGLDLRRLVAGDTGLNGLAEWRLLELYNDVMRRNAAAHGVGLIDLAHRLPKDSRYFCDLIHYSNDGARAVAEIVAAGLEPYLVR